jgi:transcriptional regulator with XRE-family HTH domain
MDIRKLVGLNLARLRNARGLKQEQLAEMTGLSQSYLSQIETGQVNLTLLRLHDLVEGLNVEPGEFFQRP